jgi:hypothetical protein
MNDVNRDPAATASSTLSSRRLGVYLSVILVAVLAASYLHLRDDTIFGCPAVLTADQYISYCNTTGYGDFDHGAFWFNLEPQATQAAAAADVLLVGNSRLGYAFSSDAAESWLTQNTQRHFLLGFAFWPQVLFHRAVLQKLNPHARVYVINLDDFFEEKASAPAHMVMEDPGARSHYRSKQVWQTLQHAVCGRVSSVCGDSYAIVRNRRTGSWRLTGVITRHSNATSDNEKPDVEAVARETAIGRKFLDGLGVDRRCVIFTVVPTVGTPFGTSAAIAQALDVQFVAPQVDDLLTFDGSHLDPPSAERWAAAFFDAAGPKIRDCLQDRPRATTARN